VGFGDGGDDALTGAAARMAAGEPIFVLRLGRGRDRAGELPRFS